MDGIDISAWLDLLSQTTRFITVDVTGANGLIVERFTGSEGVNRDFHFELDCVCASAFLDVTAPIGQRASLGIATADGGTRRWHGYVTSMLALGAEGGLARYRVVVESALAFLRTRRNTLIFQNQTALEVIGQVFADYPELAWRNEVTATLRRRPICTQYRETDHDFLTRLLGEEGLSYRFEHDTEDADEGPGHTLVVFDTAASQALPQGEPASIRYHRVDATERSDAISRFSERRQVTSSALTTSSWKPDEVRAVAGNASAPAASGEAPELPELDVFEADRAQRFEDDAQATYYATHALDARRAPTHTFSGEGAARTLEAGKTYTLTQYPDLADPAFVPLTVHHRATNNLGSALVHLLGAPDDDALGRGSYRNAFLAVPAGTPIAPLHHDKPLAPGCASARVVGVPGDALTGTRDHQVRIQFFWQRGVAPLPGGLTDTASPGHPTGHAPGNDRSGTWVRVAEANAGAHHGHSFVPRIGDEVLIEYAHGDIDQPLVIGQLYNGPATPPFAAGEDSSANHPGTLSGVCTQALDGSPSGAWVLDDASGQLRHSLGHSLADSRLDLGYLIDQQGSLRGGFRGEGFALASNAWTMLRAGEGLLVSATARTQGQSTQMDAVEAIGQLEAARQTAEHLDTAATQAQAQGLAANPAQTHLQQTLDPRQNGKYQGPVNGQDATRPTANQRSGGDPVERFAQPTVLMEAPAHLAWTSPNSTTAFVGEHLHLTSQRDTHLATGASLSLAAGQNASLYAADGGLKAFANHGPVSIEAHTDQMQILADRDVTVTSTTERVDILAKQKIVLQAGQATVTLDGQNLILACPGTFTVKTAQHQWLAGESQAAQLPVLPS